MNLEGIQHALPGDDDLLGLFLHWEGSNERRHLFRRFPLGQLTQTFLSCPNRSVDNLEEKLTRPRVEDENGSVDRLSRQVAFEGLVNSNPGREKNILSSFIQFKRNVILTPAFLDVFLANRFFDFASS